MLAAWEAQRAAAVAKLTEEALTKQFEQNKALITEKSKIKSRPANDLRREERYEVMNRMVSYLFGRGDDPSEPTPLEIEYFHRYFDIDGDLHLHASVVVEAALRVQDRRHCSARPTRSPRRANRRRWAARWAG